MPKFLERLKNAVDMRDLITFGGLGVASYGASLVYHPAGFILSGIALFWLGVRR